MTTSNINVRVDDDLKKEAENLFNDLGVNMSSAITMFLKAAIRYDGIPFEIRRDPFNAETRSALAEYDDMKTHPDEYKRYHSFSELLEDIDHEA
ncbi:MAG: type II toxin-antitoxin system RelB/DinJ family antitoxin [Eubacterium sp.]